MPDVIVPVLITNWDGSWFPGREYKPASLAIETPDLIRFEIGLSLTFREHFLSETLLPRRMIGITPESMIRSN
jgi:hypothetical protein